MAVYTYYSIFMGLPYTIVLLGANIMNLSENRSNSLNYICYS